MSNHLQTNHATSSEFYRRVCKLQTDLIENKKIPHLPKADGERDLKDWKVFSVEKRPVASDHLDLVNLQFLRLAVSASQYLQLIWVIRLRLN